MAGVGAQPRASGWDRLLGRDSAATRSLGLTRREHRRLAALLLNAARDRRAIKPLSGWNAELTVGDACSIRDAALAGRIAAGVRLVGAKVSLEGTLAKPRSGSPEPQLGWLTDAMLLRRAVVDLGELIRPHELSRSRLAVGTAWERGGNKSRARVASHVRSCPLKNSR